MIVSNTYSAKVLNMRCSFAIEFILICTFETLQACRDLGVPQMHNCTCLFVYLKAPTKNLTRKYLARFK